MRVYLISAAIVLISFVASFGCQSMAAFQNATPERPLNITGAKNGSTLLLQTNHVPENAFQPPLNIGHN
jgi:hypothetical protein